MRKWLRDANEFRNSVNRGNIRNAFFRVRTMLNEPTFRHILSMPPSRRNEPPPDMPFPHPDIFEEARVIAENYAVLEPIVDNVRSLLSRIDSGLYSATLSRWRQMAPNDDEDTSEVGRFFREVDRTIRWLKDLVDVIDRAREVSNLPWVKVTMVPLAETRKARAKAAALPQQPPIVPQSMTPGWTETVEEDMNKLVEFGFIIDRSAKGLLGQGYFGRVYKGWYDPMWWGKAGILPFDQFAVKLINQRLEVGQSNRNSKYVSTVEATQTEKLMVSLIKHPNVIDVKYIFQFGEPTSHHFQNEPKSTFVGYDRTYIIMEFADGGMLKDWIESHRIPVWRLLSIVRDISRGIRYLHAIGISHSDIYSNNVLMFTRGQGWIAKLADFGWAYKRDRSLPENAGAQDKLNRNVSECITNEQGWSTATSGDVDQLANIISEIFQSPKFVKPKNDWEKHIFQLIIALAKSIYDCQIDTIEGVFQRYPELFDEDEPVD